MFITFCAVISGMMTAVATAGTEFSTDRFGYSGSISRYATMQNAIDAVNAIGVFTIPARVTASPYNTADRDLRLYFANGVPGKTDFNKFQMAFFYTTEANTNGQAKDTGIVGTPGNNLYSGLNNPNRTQVGRLQMFDDDGSTDTFFHAVWGGFNGINYKTLTLRVQGGNVSPDDTSVGGDIARVWDGSTTVSDNRELIGVIKSYDLDITVTGITGVLDVPSGIITAIDHPTGVTGTFKGIFQNTNTINPTFDGFYAFNLSINMDNWAFGQGNAALNGNFFQSLFSSDAEPVGPSEPPPPAESTPPVTIPTPGALPIALLMMGGLATLRRWRK